MVPRQRRFPAPAYRYLRVPYRGRIVAVPRAVRWAAIAVALFLYVFQFVAGDKGVLRRYQLDRELELLQVENTRMALQKDRLLQEVQLKENDPMSLERLAREKYWMVGPGEEIYRFNEDEVVPEDTGEKPWLREDPSASPEGDAGTGAGTGAGAGPGAGPGSGPEPTK